MLDYVLDENIQVHGGNGYVRDYLAERHYATRALTVLPGY